MDQIPDNLIITMFPSDTYESVKGHQFIISTYRSTPSIVRLSCCDSTCIWIIGFAGRQCYQNSRGCYESDSQ